MQQEFTAASAIKGSIPECLDAISRGENARALMERLAKAIEASAKGDFRDLAEVFAKHLFAPAYVRRSTVDLVAYLRERWFEPTSRSAYFPEFHPIAPLYAEGVLTTLRLSLQGGDKPVPIDAWWLPGHEGFEMINLVSPHQITLLIATPRPPHLLKAPPSLREVEVWTTKRAKVDTVRFVQAPRPQSRKSGGGGAARRKRR